MSKMMVSIMSLLLMSGLLFGCASEQPKEYTDTSQAIEIGVGEQFVIALEANPTTGYGWEPEFDSGLLRLVESEYKAAAAKPREVGTGGEQRFTFEGLKQGKAEVTLTYKRSWEEGYADQKTFTVYIK